MLSKEDFLKSALLAIEDNTVIEKWQNGDPVTTQQIQSIAIFFALLSQEIEIALNEPFAKTRDRSILADATNKGILPTAIPHRHKISLHNKSDNLISISQGRLIEDSEGGRTWRLLTAVNAQAGETITAVVEQSEYREINYTVPRTEMFHRYAVELQPSSYLASLAVQDTLTPRNYYVYKPRLLSTLPDEMAYTLNTDEKRRIFVEWGADGRVGRTVKAGENFIIALWETEGEIDTTKLKDASLQSVNTTDEQRLVIKFVDAGTVQTGTNPYTIEQLRLLTSYGSVYDGSAVFLGDFDFAVRKLLLNRTFHSVVWNEKIHENYYEDDQSVKYINHLFVAFAPKNMNEKALLQEQVSNLLASQDNLYIDSTIFFDLKEIEYPIKITGQIASVYDLDTVKAQITALLINNYGRTSLMAHRWFPNGFKVQGIANLLRTKIQAFQDNFGDFTITVNDKVQYKPHEWIYITEKSITVSLDRTAETSGVGFFV